MDQTQKAILGQTEGRIQYVRISWRHPSLSDGTSTPRDDFMRSFQRFGMSATSRSPETTSRSILYLKMTCRGYCSSSASTRIKDVSGTALIAPYTSDAENSLRLGSDSAESRSNARRVRDRTRRPAALPVPAVVWVISTVDSACGRRVDDRLRGPLVVLSPGRPALVLADRI